MIIGARSLIASRSRIVFAIRRKVLICGGSSKWIDMIAAEVNGPIR